MADEAGASSAGTITSKSRPSTSRRDYEVFLNFRGPDSRHTVASVLYDALDRAGVRVFYDDESIRHGDVIGRELAQAIRNSKIYIPIFSKDYASSAWCLRELDLIIRSWDASRVREEKKMILPIFYDVDVSADLKLKSELYTTALQKHKEQEGEYGVKLYEYALRKAATIKGRDLHNHGLAELTKLIVEEVCSMLLTTSDPEKVPDDYVGIQHPMVDIMKLLDLDANDVRFVSIHGLGGVGKTTLARLVFNKISSSFGQIAFVSNVREKFCSDDGILDLQKNLMSQLLQVSVSAFLQDVDCGVKMIKERLNNKKVLIVLDDLDKSDQLLKLAGQTSWFGIGSRIITTTRDIGIMPQDEGFYRYKMQEMKHDDALKLFSKRAFNSVLPPKEYDEISREVVDTSGGLPLAIGVIAALFKNNRKDAWEGTLKKLKKVVHKDVRERLMMSYEQLDNYEKEIFLDIACLFVNKEIEDAIYYWEARQLHPKSVIMVLKNMSLIEIVDGNKLWMHDLLRDLGRNLVDEETDVHGRSRLWLPEVAHNIVRRKKGTNKVVALKLGKLNADCTFNLEQFAGLTNLNFLELNGGSLSNEDFKEVFSELRWLSWDDCPPEFQGTNLCFENLAVLMLSENLITDDWGGWGEIKVANKLKVLKCIYCRFLMKSPDFSTFPTLEILVFKNCATLREIDPSIGLLEHLTFLEISNPLIYMERLPDEYISYQLEEGGTQILPESIGNLRSLLVLKLKFVNLSKLPNSIGNLVNLNYLCLWCPKLKELPKSIKNLSSLVELDISFSVITHLRKSLLRLPKLEVFKHENCLLGENAALIASIISERLQNDRIRKKELRLLNPIRTETIESIKNK